MDWREFTAREHRYRMVAIRGHIWRICMSWRTKRGQRSAVHGAKCINDRVRSLCHCRVESRRQRPVDVADAFQVTRIQVECCRDERFVKARRVNAKNIFTELKRRNVYRAAVAYGVVAWFLTQLTTQVFRF
jgi:hypothetical protein